MEKKKKDYLLISLGFQFLICAILFGICFGLNSISSDLIVTLKKEFFDNLNDNFITTEIDNLNLNNNAEQEEKADTATNKVVESQKDTEAETQAVTEVKNSVEDELSAEIEAQGGADVNIDSVEEIPDNVSVNGYTLNRKMILPVQGETTSEFGVRVHPIGGDLRFHAGIDIAASMGTPIYAAFDGKVTVAEYDQWNGYYIKLQHDNDIMTVYCHCEKLNVKKGDVVRAGEVIGTVGSTGSSTGPHLHFELRINNVSYNPQSALDDAISAI